MREKQDEARGEREREMPPAATKRSLRSYIAKADDDTELYSKNFSALCSSFLFLSIADYILSQSRLCASIIFYTERERRAVERDREKSANSTLSV